MASESQESYQLFPGCTIQNRFPFLEKSAKYVFEKLGLIVKDNPHFGCCPDPVGVQSTDRQSWLTLGARNLALAEQDNEPIISLCNGCTETLKAVQVELNHNPEDMKIVQDRLAKVQKTYSGQVKVKHFVEFLHEKEIMEKIKPLIIKPLTGIKIAVHPGCHYSRPSELVDTDNAMDPVFQKDILKLLGATVVDYEEESMCCGSAVARVDEKISLGMLKRKFESIQYEQADILCTNCPTCYQQLETGQRQLRKEFQMEVKIPVLYITELMALAFGATQKEIGLKFHQIKAKKILAQYNFE